MPKDEKIQVNFATAIVPYYSPVPRWEHRIAVHRVARDEILLSWYLSQTDADSREQVARLTTSLFEHWVSEADQCRKDYRYLAAIHACRKALKLKSDPAVQQRLKELEAVHRHLESDRPKVRHLIAAGNYDDALRLINGILERKPNDAKMVGQLGTLYAIQGHKDRAREYWRSVITYDRDDPYGESMLGWQAYLDGQYDAAIEAYLRAEEIEPYFDKIQYHLGLALAKQARWTDAIDRFHQVLTMNPNHLEAHLGLVDAFRQSGEPEKAIPIATNATFLARDGQPAIEALNALAEAYADSARYADAERTAIRLVNMAQTRKPDMLPGIRQRIEEWRQKSRRGKN